MTFGGTTDPCAAVSLTSIGKVDANDNRKSAPQITEFIESTLKIPKDRYYRKSFWISAINSYCLPISLFHVLLHLS